MAEVRPELVARVNVEGVKGVGPSPDRVPAQRQCRCPPSYGDRGFALIFAGGSGSACFTSGELAAGLTLPKLRERRAATGLTPLSSSAPVAFPDRAVRRMLATAAPAVERTVPGDTPLR